MADDYLPGGVGATPPALVRVKYGLKCQDIIVVGKGLPLKKCQPTEGGN